MKAKSAKKQGSARKVRVSAPRDTTVVAFRMPNSLIKVLKARAEREGRTMGWLASSLIKRSITARV